jgi:hypothetical protein
VGPVTTRARIWTVAVTAAVVLVITVGAIVHQPHQPPPDRPATTEPVIVVGRIKEQGSQTAPQPSAKDVGAKPRPDVRKWTAGLSPRPWLAVAADAPILVSTGRARSIPLGAELPYDADTDIALHVWDWSKGEESRPLKVTSRSGLAVSPDGKWIVTRSGRIIDVATSAIKRLDNCGGDVRGMKFAPDGRALLLLIHKGMGTASARVIDFPSGKKRFEIDGQWPHTFACAFTSDSAEFLLVDKDRFVRRWDAKTGKELQHYEPALRNSIRAIAVSSDGKYVAAAAAPNDVALWKRAGSKLLHKLVPKQEQEVYSRHGVYSLTFTPDGKLLAGGGSQNVVLWETASGKVSRLLPSSSGGAMHLRFSQDGKKLTAVREFYGTTSARGDDLLVYPSVREWNVGKAPAKKAEGALRAGTSRGPGEIVYQIRPARDTVGEGTSSQARPGGRGRGGQANQPSDRASAPGSGRPG